MKLSRWTALAVLAALVFAAAAAGAYERQADGVVLDLQKRVPTDPARMKIQVCTDEIIRVIAAPGTSFSTRESLMVDRTSWPAVNWTVSEEGNRVVVSTGKVTVKVDQATGMTAFYDASGNLILQEKAQRGKILTPATVMDEQTFHIQQRFESPANEAFYGLGQHQDGIMNYKDHDVDLWQYNIVAVVPMLVSNRHYGILWDNNALTRFGDPRDYGPLSQLRLYGKDGTPGGLTAEYFTDAAMEEAAVTRQESELNYEFEGEFRANGPEGYRGGRGGVRWSGQMEANTPGVYKFRLYYAGYVKLWIDGELQYDEWRQGWLPWEHLFSIDMRRGERHSIRIEWSGASYFGLRVLTPDPAMADDTTMSLWSEVGDQIDYYFIHGDTMDDIIGGYRDITGQAPMMPKWALGFWQSRQRYNTRDELLGVVKEYRDLHIPIDNIVQDWFYWTEDKWGDHEFDPARWADPDGLIKELHALHTHFMISVWPKFYVGTKNFEAFQSRGWLYQGNLDAQQRDWVGRGYVSTFYDPYRLEARDLFWAQINDKLFSKGVDAWWLDATEPEPVSNLPEDERRERIGPTALGPVSRYLNSYALMNAMGIYEGQRETAPNQRVFILTRSAFAGQQRYAAATWSGDVPARWESLKLQIPAGINFSMSGIPWWTTDIGGFSVESRFSGRNVTPENEAEWREFMTRWYEYGAFLPLFRAHGEFPYREIYNIAPEGSEPYQAMVGIDNLRYRLMPYLYSLAGMITRDNYTMMRALAMDFPNDGNVNDIPDQYMFGPALMVNPVYEYQARSRNVYLPAGTGWYHLQSGFHFPGGGNVEIGAPLSDIPLFVREGAVIPFGPSIQYSDEKPANPIRLMVYTGADGEFTLYEDENVNYNYEHGAFSTIPFAWDDGAGTLTIGERSGEFPGMLRNRTFEITWVDSASPEGFSLDTAPDRTVQYNGSEMVVRR